MLGNRSVLGVVLLSRWLIEKTLESYDMLDVSFRRKSSGGHDRFRFSLFYAGSSSTGSHNASVAAEKNGAQRIFWALLFKSGNFFRYKVSSLLCSRSCTGVLVPISISKKDFPSHIVNAIAAGYEVPIVFCVDKVSPLDPRIHLC